jgi:hypothetical protein
MPLNGVAANTLGTVRRRSSRDRVRVRVELTIGKRLLLNACLSRSVALSGNSMGKRGEDAGLIEWVNSSKRSGDDQSVCTRDEGARKRRRERP